MSRSLTVEVGAFNAESSKGGRLRSRALVLAGKQAARGIDGVFAIVEARAEQIDDLCEAVLTPFRAGGRAKTLTRGSGEAVARALVFCDQEDVSVTLAVLVDQSVVLGSCGQRYASLWRKGKLVDVALELEEAASGTGARVRRFVGSPGDCLALFGKSGMEEVTESELEQTISVGFSPAFSPQDAAHWLAALAAGRSKHDASAIVVHFLPRRWVGVVPQDPDPALRGTKSRTQQTPPRQAPAHNLQRTTETSLLHRARTLLGQRSVEPAEDMPLEAGAAEVPERTRPAVPAPQAPSEPPLKETPPTALIQEAKGVRLEKPTPSPPEQERTVVLRREDVAQRVAPARPATTEQTKFEAAPIGMGPESAAGGAPVELERMQRAQQKAPAVEAEVDVGASTKAPSANVAEPETEVPDTVELPLAHVPFETEQAVHDWPEAEVIEARTVPLKTVQAEPISQQEMQEGIATALPPRADLARGSLAEPKLVAPEPEDRTVQAQSLVTERSEAELVGQEPLHAEPGATVRPAQEPGTKPIVPLMGRAEPTTPELVAPQVPDGADRVEQQRRDASRPESLVKPMHAPQEPHETGLVDSQTVALVGALQAQETRTIDRAPVPQVAERKPMAAETHPPSERAQGKRLLLVGAILALILAVAGASAYFVVSSSSHRATRPSGSGNTGIPAAAQVWRFPPLSKPAQQIVLTLTNPNRVAVGVQLSLTSPGLRSIKIPVQQEQIPAGGGAELTLDPQTWRARLRLQATAPIVPVRIVMRQNRVESSYGIRVAGPTALHKP